MVTPWSNNSNDEKETYNYEKTILKANCYIIIIAITKNNTHDD